MKLISTLILSLVLNFAFSQDFYDMNTIQTIKISFGESNWDQLLDNAYATTEDYVFADSVEINGVVFDSVGVKYKGNSTYNSNQSKNPFHIELDTYKDQDYDGFTDIKLSNVAKDPSFLREVVSYQILRQYMVGPQSNYANVYVNGNLIGLYSNSEAVSKKFVNSYFGSKSNTFVKCNPPAGAGPQSNDLPTLEYLGQDSTDYYDAYEIKSDAGWADLINLCDTLNNELGAIETILDVDKTLWMHAFNNALVNLDSYSGQFTQNYYLYRNDYGQFMPVVWDLNESFGTFSATGSSNLNNTAAKQQMDHLLHSNDSDFPLIQQILSIPLYRRMYFSHLKTIMEENIDNENYYAVATTLKDLIDESVQADDNKFFTYNNFLDNLDDDITGGGGPGGGPGGGSTPGIANLMDGRNTYLLNLPDFVAAQPSITDISLSSSEIVIGESVAVSASVADANAVYIGYRSESDAPFTRIEMNDDGTAGDAVAGDGIYTASLDIQVSYTQYYIYADNDNIGKFSPARAAHEYHTIIANSTSTVAGDLVINEFLASNDITQEDQDGEFDDWIELYNNTSEDILLDGYFLSDDADDLTQWAIPEGTSIAGNGYLIIWADKDDEQVGLHANFKLSSSAESIFLVDPTETIIDEITYLDQVEDVSLGRFPNGTGDFISMIPTFNAENMMTVSVDPVIENTVSISTYPNPTSGSFQIVINEQGNKAVEIYDAVGEKIFGGIMNQRLVVQTSSWVPGIYIIKIGDGFAKIVVE